MTLKPKTFPIFVLLVSTILCCQQILFHKYPSFYPPPPQEQQGGKPMSAVKAKMLEMEAQMKVLRLEKELEEVRGK